MFSQEYVHSDEELYRFFKDIPAIVEVTDDGWRLKRSAFTGGSKDSKEVSVDRAWLRDYDPTASQRESSNGVVCFVTRDIREDKSVPDRNFDVEPDPIEEGNNQAGNPAHAKITADPEIKTDGQLKKLQRLLQKLYKCVILPESQRQSVQ